MKQRLKGALLLLPLILAFFAGDVVFTILSIVLGIVGFIELKIAFSKKGICVPIIFAAIIPALLLLISFANISNIVLYAIFLAILFIYVIALLLEKVNIIDFSVTILSILYSFLPFWLISRVYVLDGGLKYTVLIFIISCVTDMSAMLIGKFFGKHKLIPNISPNKTIEGSIGGIICTVIACVIYGYFTNISIAWIIPLAIVGGIVAQIGDLFASTIKRHCDIKDFSNLIPGHGGVLDRFDSAGFVALLMSIVLFI